MTNLFQKRDELVPKVFPVAIAVMSVNSLVIFTAVQYGEYTRSEQIWKRSWLILKLWVGKTGKEIRK